MRIALLMASRCPWARQIAKQLAELGHEVHVIDFRKWLGGEGYHRHDAVQADSIGELGAYVAGIHLLESHFRYLRYFACRRQLRNICRRCGADVLLSLYGGGWAAAAYSCGFRPYAVYVVGSDVLRAGRVNRWISRRTLGRAAMVFANGRFLAEKTRAMAPAARVVPLVIGSDLARYVPRPTCSSTVKIICTRGFVPVYNNEYVIHGLAAMSATENDFRVVFVSRGPGLDGVRALADRVLSPPWRERVEFLGGVTDEEMLHHLGEADVYISVSRSDGTSISLLEALSCGLFPILSDIPQHHEWIDPQQGNGILVPLDKPAALAAAMQTAITDAPRRARARETNLQLARDRADCRRNMQTLVEKLQENL